MHAKLEAPGGVQSASSQSSQSSQRPDGGESWVETQAALDFHITRLVRRLLTLTGQSQQPPVNGQPNGQRSSAVAAACAPFIAKAEAALTRAAAFRERQVATGGGDTSDGQVSASTAAVLHAGLVLVPHGSPAGMLRALQQLLPAPLDLDDSWRCATWRHGSLPGGRP
jgi:hypothetical protein